MRCCSSGKKEDILGVSYSSSGSALSSSSPPLKLLTDAGLDLMQIQVIFRHGARTPLNFVSGIAEATYDRHIGLELPEINIPHQVVNMLTGKPAEPSPMEQDFKDVRLKGGCRAAVLTTVGQKQMLSLGRKIKDTYLAPLQLSIYNPSLVKIRSSNIERTIKSLQCVMVGIFGRLTLTKLGPLRLPVKDIWDEDMFPNKLCCAALRLAVNMTLANLESIPDYVSDKREVLRALGLPAMGHLDFSCIKDDVTSRTAHGKPYPKVLEPYRDIIEVQSARVLRAVTTGRIEGSDNPPRNDVLMMSIGRLLNSILLEMEDLVCGVLKPRMYLYSGHDTTVIPILEVLGLPQTRWPPFGATIIFELYKSRSPHVEKQFYVRVIYCWKEVTLPCYKETLIPFPVFRQTLSRYALSPSEFRRMCGATPLGQYA